MDASSLSTLEELLFKRLSDLDDANAKVDESIATAIASRARVDPAQTTLSGLELRRLRSVLHHYCEDTLDPIIKEQDAATLEARRTLDAVKEEKKRARDREQGAAAPQKRRR